MAQIKITITIEADLMRDAHAAVDAMDARLRKSDGRVVRARLTQEPKDRMAADVEWTPVESRGSDDIFERVMAAMRPAEELGGPEGAQYVALMEQVAHEAQRRANTMRDTLAGTDEHIMDGDEGSCTDECVATHPDHTDTRGEVRS
jgi:hypothetical protein